MRYDFDGNKKMNSHFIEEMYFPVVISFSSAETDNDFIDFYYSDTDLFEIAADKNTGIIKQFRLTLCHHFVLEQDKKINLHCKEGTLTFPEISPVRCNCFLLHIYSGSVKIDLNETSPSQYLKAGQLVFDVNSKGELSSLYITDLSEHNIGHIVEELNASAQQV